MQVTIAGKRGHNFCPNHFHNVEARKHLGNLLTVALIAAATPKVQSEIICLLNLPKSIKCIATGFNCSNPNLEVKYRTNIESKFHALSKLLGNSNSANWQFTPQEVSLKVLYTSLVFPLRLP